MPVDSLIHFNNPTLVAGQRVAKRKVGTRSTEAILDEIIPPREWEDAGQLWQQHVSSTPATRLDVIMLQEQLDAQLKKRGARDVGLDPVRQALYEECFDDLIRQVTINCLERGLLMVKIRDEIRQTVAAFRTGYQSAMAFGLRNSIRSTQSKETLGDRIRELEKELDSRRAEVQRWTTEIESRLRLSTEAKEAARAQHQATVKDLKEENAKLRDELHRAFSVDGRGRRT